MRLLIENKEISRRGLLKNIGATVMLPFLCGGCFGIDNIEIVQHEITLVDSLLPDKSIILVQISDLHLHSLNDSHEKTIKEINRIKPDIIFITGDIINESPKLSLIFDYVSQLKASVGKFSVPGNWDYWSLAGINNIRKEYAKANCRFLVNEKVNISLQGINLSIIGIDDYSVGKPDLKCLSDDNSPSSYRILLSHCPGFRNEIKNREVDLVLSGHTHGGQINIFGYTPYTPEGSGKYISGWYNVDNPLLYVNRGLGTTFLPVRIGSRPEITVLKILNARKVT